MFRQRAGEIDRGRRLANAAFLVRDRDHIRHVGITSTAGISDAGSSTGRDYCHATPSDRAAGVVVIHSLGELFTESVDIRASFSGRPSTWFMTRCSPTMMSLSLRKDTRRVDRGVDE